MSDMGFALHEQYMQRALELAELAEGHTSPNPLVGCVVVKDNAIIGEGWHQVAGQAHAEVRALENCSGDPAGGTLYVTLEPCSHTGRTPPCTDAIIAAGIKTVVYAVSDPNPVAGGGKAILERNHISVITGVLEKECQYQNRFYLHFQSHQTPYVIAKFAASLDGKIATRTGHSQWITGERARNRAHSLRQAVDAILVGAQTVIDDDPKLTTRLSGSSRHTPSHPLRIVLDGNARVPVDQTLFSGNLPGQTLIATTDAMSDAQEQQLTANGVEVLKFGRTSTSTRIPLDSLLQALGERSIQSLMVEGGQTVLGAFNDARLINELWAFMAPMIIGGTSAISAVGGFGTKTLDEVGRINSIETENLHPDILIRGEMNYSQECI